MNNSLITKLKNITGRSVKYTGISLFIIGLVLVAFFYENLIYVTSKPQDILDALESDNLSNKCVTIGIDGVVGNYAINSTKVNGITVKKDYYYLTWLDNDSFIGVKVPKSDLEQMDDICDQTFAYVNGETQFLPDKVQYKGIIKKSESKISTYLNEFMTQTLGMTGEEANDLSYKYYIDISSISGIGLALSIFGALLTILGAIMFLFNKQLSGAKKAVNGAIKDGAMLEVLNNDFDNGSRYAHIVVGKKYIFAASKQIEIFNGNNIAWIHVTSSGNKKKQVYFLAIYTVEAKKYMVELKPNEVVSDIGTVISNNFPHIEIGVKDELFKLIKNKDAFKARFANNSRETNSYNSYDTDNEYALTDDTNYDVNNNIANNTTDDISNTATNDTTGNN